MATLYQLAENIERVIDEGFVVDEETGEVLFEAADLEQMLEGLNAKIESCGVWMKNQRALAEAIRAEEKALYERRKQIESRLEKMDAYVVRGLMMTESHKVETPLVKMGVRKASSVVVDDEAAVPDKFKTVVETVKVSKTELRKELSQGVDVPGAHMETSVRLQLK